jgi:NAD(P)H-dependent FMN reductase
MTNIKIIVGSTRPNRFGIQPATWIYELAKKHPEAKFDLVDLQEVNLPMFNEATPPLMHQYAQEHTKKWAELIGNADGFVMVTPEYNHSFPAALKNAIDYLATEWGYKPVAFVSYGADAGGTRAIEQLRVVTSGMRMYDLGEQVTLANYWAQLNEEGKFLPNDQQNDAAEKLLTAVAFWSEKMKAARADMKK